MYDFYMSKYVNQITRSNACKHQHVRVFHRFHYETQSFFSGVWVREVAMYWSLPVSGPAIVGRS